MTIRHLFRLIHSNVLKLPIRYALTPCECVYRLRLVSLLSLHQLVKRYVLVYTAGPLSSPAFSVINDFSEYSQFKHRYTFGIDITGYFSRLDRFRQINIIIYDDRDELCRCRVDVHNGVFHSTQSQRLAARPKQQLRRRWRGEQSCWASFLYHVEYDIVFFASYTHINFFFFLPQNLNEHFDNGHSSMAKKWNTFFCFK